VPKKRQDAEQERQSHHERLATIEAQIEGEKAAAVASTP
jgi:hypothetical protein